MRTYKDELNSQEYKTSVRLHIASFKMRLDKSLIAISALVAVYSTPIKSSKHDFNLRSFIVDLKGVERLRNLARNTFLPDEREYPGLGDTAGIDLDILKDLRHQWVTDYDWQEEQRYINRSAWTL